MREGNIFTGVSVHRVRNLVPGLSRERGLGIPGSRSLLRVLSEGGTKGEVPRDGYSGRGRYSGGT